MKWKNLKTELRDEAYDDTEAAELEAIARQVSQMELPNLSSEAKARIAGEIGFASRWKIQPWMLPSAITAVFTLVSVIALAQFSNPGSPLHSIKVQTDKLQHLILPEASQSPSPSSGGQNRDASGEDRSGSGSGSDDSSSPSSSGTFDDNSGSNNGSGSSGSSGGDSSGSSGNGSSGSSGSGSSGSDDDSSGKGSSGSGSSGGGDDSGGGSNSGKD